VYYTTTLVEMVERRKTGRADILNLMAVESLPPLTWLTENLSCAAEVGVSVTVGVGEVVTNGGVVAVGGMTVGI